MPWWGGAVHNEIQEVQPTYVTLKVKAFNGLKLNDWTHHTVNTTLHSNWTTKAYWEQRPPFTMFVFCPFNTTEGGFSPGQGTMRFPDFYKGECSADGRLCSFMSRGEMELYREEKDNSAHFRGTYHI